ncbi:MAG: lipoyl(octanoyl) transferase LipB [Alphaproteobacteria bacterium]|nr:lipoyl(octanoyl) transferase LipB [Alphaproteobacteria bacterium]
MEWKTSLEPVDYEDALREMDARVMGIYEGTEDELVWLLEHPPLYTAGTSAKEKDLLEPQFPVYKTGRGGEYTYHGYGQRVAYVMLNLKKRQQRPDIKQYVYDLESWIIGALESFGIVGERRSGRIGIWVNTNFTNQCDVSNQCESSEKKIAALGVRIRRWVSLHGISINVNPDLSHFNGIVPCGISEYGVTSMEEILGSAVSMDDLDDALKESWAKIFDVSLRS